MNFQKVPPIYDGKFYLDTAIQRAKKHVNSLTIKTKNEDKKTEIKEKTRVKVIVNNLKTSLSLIINSFPSIDGLDEFYFELSKNSFNVDLLKKSLSTISWAPKKINELEKEFAKKTKNKDKPEILKQKKAFFGRISSIIKRLNNKLLFIEEVRRILITFPDVKKDLFTICITGFPNVGKSTLLSKITTSKPEIGSYAFTTKSLNTGYFTIGFEKIQVIDVPGTLNRFDKMNNIEKQAHLAIKYLANIIVYVYDLTEPYPLKEQQTLLENIQKTKKPIIIYVSKEDLLGKEKIKEFIKKIKTPNTCSNPQTLKKIIQQTKQKNT